MIVEAMLPAARDRLIILGDEASLIDAARLLRDLEADLVVVRKSDGGVG
ncbi:hypothetical protein [Bradyrhizobium sp. CCBAU 45384]|nr:hypothetical protein [Bradyrhizobium sp. CCBAU 45384]